MPTCWPTTRRPAASRATGPEGPRGTCRRRGRAPAGRGWRRRPPPPVAGRPRSAPGRRSASAAEGRIFGGPTNWTSSARTGSRRRQFLGRRPVTVGGHDQPLVRPGGEVRRGRECSARDLGVGDGLAERRGGDIDELAPFGQRHRLLGALGRRDLLDGQGGARHRESDGARQRGVRARGRRGPLEDVQTAGARDGARSTASCPWPGGARSRSTRPGCPWPGWCTGSNPP